MSAMIKKFYEENNIPGILLNQKLSKLEQNEDIATEFEYWIEHRKYKTDNAVSIEGYTAKSLADESQYLNGEGAFMILIELREDPRKAKEKIARGFKRK